MTNGHPEESPSTWQEQEKESLKEKKIITPVLATVVTKDVFPPQNMALGHGVFTKFRPPGIMKTATLRLYLQTFISILNRCNRNCTATDTKLIAVVTADIATLKPRAN